MKEIAFFKGDTRAAGLKKLFQIEFIAQAFFELVFPEADYSPLLTINHEDRFLSLSNAEYYILLLPGQTILNEAREHLNSIQNRRKMCVLLQGQPEGQLVAVSLEQIRDKAVKNGIPGKNLFLKLLEEFPEVQFISPVPREQ